MIVKTLEIGWHEAKLIYSCDFQRRSTRTPQGTVAHKFATAGADTHVRVSHFIIALKWLIRAYGAMIDLTLTAYFQIWLIHPTDPTATTQGERSPRAEYLSTLTKHSGAVNVVRWSPNGTSHPSSIA
jgi:chromatin assembly factor 1 subunit B